MSPRPLIIGFIGPMGAGKSTAADVVVRTYDAVRKPFAGPLKEMIRSLGVPFCNVYGTPEQKAEPLDILCGRSARYAMQTLGTQWGRDCIDVNFWTNVWMYGVKSIICDAVVVDDVRFQNEVDLIKSMGGIIIRITRPGYGETCNHESEAYWSSLSFDVEIKNEKTMFEFSRQVLDVVQEFMVREVA